MMAGLPSVLRGVIRILITITSPQLTVTGFIDGDDSMSNVRHITSKFHHLSASHAGAARLAQSVEHQTFNLRVMGSSPILGDFNFFFSF